MTFRNIRHLLCAALLINGPVALGQDSGSVLDKAKKAAEDAKAKAQADANKAAAKARKAAADAKAQAKKAEAKANTEGKKVEAKAQAEENKARAKANAEIKAGKKKLGTAPNGAKGKTKKAAPPVAGSQGSEKAAEKKTIQPLNLITFTLGVGLATISSHPSPPPGETANFDAKGHSLVGIGYNLGLYDRIRPTIYYNYVPIDIVVRSGPRTFRGVWHSHQLGAKALFYLSQRHGLAASFGATATVTELNPSDFIKEYAAGELVGNRLGAHLSVGYEFAMMASFHLGAQFSATFGTIGYTSAMLYSTFLL